MFEYLLAFIALTVILIFYMPTEKTPARDKALYIITLALWIYTIAHLAFC